MKVLIVNGPNLDRLDIRDSKIYGNLSYQELSELVSNRARELGFEPEITAKIARQQVRIQEVGVSYNCRSWKEGKKIGVKDLINTLYCIVRYNWFKN